MPASKRVFRIRVDAGSKPPAASDGAAFFIAPVLLAVLVFHAFGFWAWKAARETNRRLLRTQSVGFAPTPKADPALAAFSAEILRFACEFFALPSCAQLVTPEPRSVRALRSKLSALDKIEYGGHFEDRERFLLLLVDSGLHNELEELLSSGFLTSTHRDRLTLLRFSSDWHLATALTHWALGRYEDAVAWFDRFASVGTKVARDGYWVSLSGLDLTDLPVLASVFCDQQDRLHRSRCLYGLLQATALSLSSAGGANDLHSDFRSSVRWYLHDRAIDLADAYSSQPDRFRDAQLVLYLRKAEEVASRLGPLDELELAQLTTISSPRRKAAVSYLIGRGLLLGLSDAKDAGRCVRFYDAGQAAFQSAIDLDELRIFTGPAKGKLRILERLLAECANG